MLAVIAAVSENNVIGKNNGLPWDLPEDLKRFRQITIGKTVLMGRKTFESILARLKKPLPDRKNIVITRQVGYKVPAGVLVFNSFESALENVQDEDVYVIGGRDLFEKALPLAKKFYLTRVKGSFEGDVFFPYINFSEWELRNKEIHDRFEFLDYEKKP